MHTFTRAHRHTPCTHNALRPNTPHVPLFPCTTVDVLTRAQAHTRIHTHGEDWAFLSLAKPQTAENQAEVEQPNLVKGEETKGRENEVCVGGVREGGAREPSAEEKNLDLLKKGKPSDRAGMQAVIRIASTVSRFEKDRQTGCTCSMAIPSLDNVGKACVHVRAHVCVGMHGCL